MKTNTIILILCFILMLVAGCMVNEKQLAKSNIEHERILNYLLLKIH